MSCKVFLHLLSVISCSNCTSWGVSWHLPYDFSRCCLSTSLIATLLWVALCCARITLPNPPSPSKLSWVYSSSRSHLLAEYRQTCKRQSTNSSWSLKNRLFYPPSPSTRTRAWQSGYSFFAFSTGPYAWTLSRFWNWVSGYTSKGCLALLGRDRVRVPLFNWSI